MDFGINRYVSSLRIGPPQTRERLTVFPLLSHMEIDLDYLLLQQALERDLLEVREVSGGGEIGQLEALNRSPHPVLFLDGEALVGAKQNRIVNASILLPGRSSARIPVSCIEAGRWSETGKPYFSATDTVFPSRGRRQKLTDTTTTLRLELGFGSNQSRVWDTVSGYLDDTGTFSTTDSFVDCHTERLPELDELVRAFRALPQQVGVVVFIDDDLQGVEAVSKVSTWKNTSSKLIRSYAIDALIRKKEASHSGLSPNAIHHFLDALQSSPREVFFSIGDAKDIRMVSHMLIASALVVDEGLLHLTAFPNLSD